MKIRSLLFSALWLGLSVPMPAADATAPEPAAVSASKPAELVALQMAATKSWEEDKAAAAQRRAKLDALYEAGLDKLHAQFQPQGDLTSVLAVETEKGRIHSKAELSDEQRKEMPAPLAALLARYEVSQKALEAEALKQEQASHAKYQHDLRALQTALTRRELISQALAVKAELESELASAAALEPSRPAAPPAVPPAAAQPARRAAPSPGFGAAALPSPFVDQMDKLADGRAGSPLKLGKKGMIKTTAKFKPPVEIVIEAKTDSTNLRLSYAADQVIFNWEEDHSQLRVDGGPASGHHQKGQGLIPVDQYVTVRWVVTPGKQSIYVDEQLRFEHSGDYSGIDKPVRIFGGAGSDITVKTLKVRQLPPGTEQAP